MNVQAYSFLGQTEEDRKAIFLRLPPRTFGCYKARKKISPFVKFEIILPLFCYLLDPINLVPPVYLLTLLTVFQSFY